MNEMITIFEWHTFTVMVMFLTGMACTSW